MIRKIKTVLFQPRFIGLYLKEKMWKSLLMLFIAILIAITPAAILILKTDGISASFKNELINNLVEENIEDSYIQDYKFVSSNEYVIEYTYFNVIMGTDITFENMSAYNIVLKEDGLNFLIGNVEAYYISYEDLNVKDLDFSKVSKYDISESNKVIYLFNQLYKENKLPISAFYISYYLIEMIIVTILGGVLMGFISFMYTRNGDNIMPIKYRIKTCINCQYIYLLFFFISYLYSAFYLQMIGNIFMIIYVVISTTSIKITKGRVK